jgi:DNA-binding PadR family transcriptional regulator
MNFQFDKMISAPCRLGILATLVPGEAVSFTEMKAATSLSDGNLHAQTRKLGDAGYIETNKIMNGRRSVTEFRITELGRQRLQIHINKLQNILDADTGHKRPVQRSVRADDSMVWA